MDIDSIKLHFSLIQDTRQRAKIDYPLFDILFASLCAIIAGARGWTEIREYVLGHHDWFIKQKMFEESIPVDDTFSRLIGSIKPHVFQECFLAWMRSVHKLTQGDIVAIDGKTLRGSYNRDDRLSTIHMVSAYASANQLVLGQIKTQSKSNEITAIPALIKMLELRGALVTLDAMGCQTKIATAILKQGGDYLLAVKDNQATLAQAVRTAFTSYRKASLDNSQLQTEKHHGRIESRTCHVLSAEQLAGDFSVWPELKSLVMVENFRTEKGKATTVEPRYYISSKELSADEAGSAIRAHWGIESMHWILDVTFHEDACQIYRENAAENLACLRHIGLNMMRSETTKISMPMKQRRCMMRTDFLERVLLAGFTSVVN